MIRFDLYQASQLDERSVPDNTQIQIELQVGGLTLLSTTGLTENGQVRPLARAPSFREFPCLTLYFLW